MKKRSRSDRKKRNILLAAALALLCIGGVELLACRYFDNDLYLRLTAPARQCAATVSDAGRSALASFLALFQQAPEPAPTEDPDAQTAGQPLLISDAPAADPTITELKTMDGRQLLTGPGLSTVYFNQGDDLWADRPYGTDDIGRYGCGPTVMAMVVDTLTDYETDPAAMAQFAVKRGYWARKSGSYLSLVEGAASEYGLSARSHTGRTPDSLLDTLLSGQVMVALMGPGHFTQKGHFILLRGVTLTGGVLVADPNSLERSLMVWDPQLILDELSSSTSSGAPLWVIDAA